LKVAYAAGEAVDPRDHQHLFVAARLFDGSFSVVVGVEVGRQRMMIG
jgi:hypothetical protein